MSWLVRNVVFQEEGVVIDYLEPEEDLRANGLMANHAIFIPIVDEYADELDALIDASRDLLSKAISDFAKAPTASVQLASGEDEAGPYDNPLERDGVTS